MTVSELFEKSNVTIERSRPEIETIYDLAHLNDFTPDTIAYVWDEDKEEVLEVYEIECSLRDEFGQPDFDLTDQAFLVYKVVPQANSESTKQN